MAVFSVLPDIVEIKGKIVDTKSLVLIGVSTCHHHLEVVVFFRLVGQYIREYGKNEIDFRLVKIKDEAFACHRIFLGCIIALVFLAIAFKYDINIAIRFLCSGNFQVAIFQMFNTFPGQRKQEIIVPVSIVRGKGECDEFLGINLIREPDDCIGEIIDNVCCLTAVNLNTIHNKLGVINGIHRLQFIARP